MAIVYNGTKNSLPAAQLPDAYVKPVVVEIPDYEYVQNVELIIPKATVQNADPATTIANIIADAAVGINKQITDKLGAEFLASANITAYGDLIGLKNNFQSMAKDSEALTDAAASYVATLRLYVKAA